ncbi:hypothetical protein V474_02445 [Novosphingobium barchaimii LL02]|uniref:DUF3667 domain-containing protein n=2 Tax=Novosphingobium barchaimii TaxID=1420591 RepID=A0A0J7XJU5_9SPHN|nr:hypothetical protein V474_02445 [Novosphingobium barchaimii LL02]
MPMLRRAIDAVLKEPAIDFSLPLTNGVDQAWLDASTCRNCGATLATPYCGQCGQKAAARLAWHDTVRESWERLRIFEGQMLGTLARLLLTPGRVAQEYVMGRRSANMHPLKLLVALVAILALTLAANGYFGHYAFRGRNADVDLMAARVMTYANWSFSLGIIAIYVGSWSVLRRRPGYNAIEHAVLSIYAQSVILGIIVLNMLPTLIWRDPAFVLWHKSASQYYVPAVKLLVVAAAYKQFFLLKIRTDWPRLLLACVIFAGVNWLLLRLYALLILWLVTDTTIP